MRIKWSECGRHLSAGIKPWYLVSGDEPVLVDQVCSEIRAAARKQGVDERQVFDIEQHSKSAWRDFQDARASRSLFAGRRLLEVRCRSGKLGREVGGLLSQMIKKASSEDVCLLRLPKLEASILKTAWAKALEQVGVHVQIWPLQRQEAGQWVRQEAARQGLKLERDAVDALVQLTEGNLLASRQWLMRLALQYAGQTVAVSELMAAGQDDACFTAFSLVDGILQGDAERLLHVLDHLERDRAPAALLLWALQREYTQILALLALQGRMSLRDAMRQLHVWPMRQALMQQAVQRHPAPHWQRALDDLAGLDWHSKGWSEGLFWLELRRCSLWACTGQSLLCDALAQEQAYMPEQVWMG